MGLLRLVGSLKLQVSFAECSLFCRTLLRKRPMFLGSLLIVATLCQCLQGYFEWALDTFEPRELQETLRECFFLCGCIKGSFECIQGSFWVYVGLFRVYRGLFWAPGAAENTSRVFLLVWVCKGSFDFDIELFLSVYRALFSMCGALLSYVGLFSVTEVLLGVTRALLGAHWALLAACRARVSTCTI